MEGITNKFHPKTVVLTPYASLDALFGNRTFTQALRQQSSSEEVKQTTTVVTISITIAIPKDLKLQL
eukprot:4996520-Amphidinium_carterae.1